MTECRESTRGNSFRRVVFNDDRAVSTPRSSKSTYLTWNTHSPVHRQEAVGNAASPVNAASRPRSFDPPKEVTPGPISTFKSVCTKSSKLYQPMFEMRYLRLTHAPI